MRFFALLPAVLAAGALALPAADINNAHGIAVRNDVDITARATLLADVEKTVDDLGLTLTSTIDELLAKLGLSAVTSDIDSLLAGLVGEVDTLVDDIDDVVDGLLKKLGLGGVVNTIDDLEKALGLSPTNTIGTLLTDLGIL